MKATEQYFPVELFIMLYKVVQNFESVDGITEVWPFKWKLLTSTFLCYCLNIMLYKFILTSESLNEVLECAMQRKRTKQYLSEVYIMLNNFLYNVFSTQIGVSTKLLSSVNSRENYWWGPLSHTCCLFSKAVLKMKFGSFVRFWIGAELALERTR